MTYYKNKNGMEITNCKSIQSMSTQQPVQDKIDELIDEHNFKLKYSIGNPDL